MCRKCAKSVCFDAAVQADLCCLHGDLEAQAACMCDLHPRPPDRQHSCGLQSHLVCSCPMLVCLIVLIQHGHDLVD